jgi:hypothetical protein
MMKYAGFVGLIGLFACGGSDDKDTPDTGTPTDSQACVNNVAETFPIDGSSDAFYRTNVEFTLAVAEPTASIAVADASGAPVAGTSTVDSTLVTWTPADALLPGTKYTATLTWGCDPLTISFTTSATGAAVGDPTSLVHNTYQLSLSDGRFVEPADFGDVLGLAITVDVLMMVTNADESSVHFMGAVSCPPATDTTSECAGGDTSTQDVCNPSIDFPTDADFTANPFFSVGPETTTLSVAGQDLSVIDLKVSGAFTADGEAIQGAALSGSIDTRGLAGSELIPATGDNAACDFLSSTLGISCEECSNGVGPYCLTLSVEDMTATLLPGVVLQAVDEATATANTEAGTCVP